MNPARTNLVNLAAVRASRRPGFATFVAFDSDSPEFVRGWECGQLLARLSLHSEQWSGTYHASNRAMLRRIAKASGYEIDITASEDPGWVFAAFEVSP